MFLHSFNSYVGGGCCTVCTIKDLPLNSNSEHSSTGALRAAARSSARQPTVPGFRFYITLVGHKIRGDCYTKEHSDALNRVWRVPLCTHSLLAARATCIAWNERRADRRSRSRSPPLDIHAAFDTACPCPHKLWNRCVLYFANFFFAVFCFLLIIQILKWYLLCKR